MSATHFIEKQEDSNYAYLKLLNCKMQTFRYIKRSAYKWLFGHIIF